MGRTRRAAVVVMVASTALAGCGGPGAPGTGAGARSSGGTSAGSSTTTTRSSTTAGDSAQSLPRLVDSAEWVRRDGVRALKVTPSRLLRDASDSAVFDEAWRRVVVAIPAADKAGMKDQFVCHAAFASSKSAWYLEPARPDVGYWATVRARCNPGDVRDVG